MTCRASRHSLLACVALLTGCAMLPIDAARDAQSDDERAACVERSAAVQAQAEAVLGRDASATRRSDPLAPGNIAATKAQNELSNCLRTRKD